VGWLWFYKHFVPPELRSRATDNILLLPGLIRQNINGVRDKSGARDNNGVPDKNGARLTC